MVIKLKESDYDEAGRLIREVLAQLGAFLETDSDLRRFLIYDRRRDLYKLHNYKFIDSFNDWLKNTGDSEKYLFVGDREAYTTVREYYTVYLRDNGNPIKVGTFIIEVPEYRDDGSAAIFYFKTVRHARIKAEYGLGSQAVTKNGQIIRYL